MNIINIVAIAVGPAMDAFAVSIAAGVHLKNVEARQFFRLSWHFGLFQAMMPVIGWSAGISIQPYIKHIDHWIAFILLCIVGGHMIREALEDEHEKKVKKDPTKGVTLVVLSCATSIDALAVGLGISMLNVSIWFPAFIIGVVASGFTIAGLRIGQKIGAGSRLNQYAEIMGGGILIAIDLNIFREHGVF